MLTKKKKKKQILRLHLRVNDSEPLERGTRNLYSHKLSSIIVTTQFNMEWMENKKGSYAFYYDEISQKFR